VTVLREEQDFAVLVEQTAAGLVAQNVRYAEVILTPHVHMARGVHPETIFEGIEKGRIAALDRHGIELRWVPDFAGHQGPPSGEATLNAVLSARLDSIIGFNVGGIEVDRDVFTGLFRRARDAGLHSIPHAGEISGPGGPARMWSAIYRLGAERIGHGIRCLEDPALVDYLVATGLPLDVCPTSNLRTRVVTDLAAHPLPAMLEAGLICTLNSDDPPMFDTDLTNEYRAAARMGLPPAALVDLARNGVRASYADQNVKKALLAEIDGVEQGKRPDMHGIEPPLLTHCSPPRSDSGQSKLALAHSA
jgi:aminodeoxyfutalosine deaminase